MKASCSLAIVGSGVTGLSTAYSLCKRGLKDIVILEKGHLSSGASTRNGGGVRAQFTTQENIMLAKWSIRKFKRLASELGVNFWFRQGGYLFLAESDEELSTLRKAVSIQNENKLDSRIIDQCEIKSLVPEIEVEGLVGGSFRKGDAVLFPFPLLFGYASFLRNQGVSIETRCEAKNIKKAPRGYDIETTRGLIHASKILNAAGGWSSEVSQMLGCPIPTRPVRHQIMASAPLKPFLDPMVVTIRDGFYMSQAVRGELIGGIAEPLPHPSDTSRNGSLFCRLISKRITGLFPRLSSACMMRQWAGFYDMSPDANPILDILPGTDNAYVACGFSGHGFMISPAVGDFMACLIMDDRPCFPAEPYRLDRFQKEGVSKEALVIG